MNLSVGVNVELTDVLEAYDGESFQWYFSIVEFFNGIFLNIGSFNGTQQIFPFWNGGDGAISRGFQGLADEARNNAVTEGDEHGGPWPTSSDENSGFMPIWRPCRAAHGLFVGTV